MPRKARAKIEVFQFINIPIKDNAADKDVCWEWKQDAPVAGRDNRPTFTFGGRRMLAYRVTYELMIKADLDSDTILRHRCDNKMCCNPYHLDEGTHQQNMDDMKERERHGLPHHTVKAIKKLLSKNRPHDEIADLYGISRQTVTAINTGRIYKHVADKDE